MLILEVTSYEKIIALWFSFWPRRLLLACGQQNTIGEANAAASQDDGKLRIVTTIFP